MKYVTKPLIILCGVLTLSLSQGGYAASSSKINSNSNLPLAGSKLPYTPHFTPTSGAAGVFQNYNYDNWHYKVQYVYGASVGRWIVWAYSARLVRFPDGSLVPTPSTSSTSEGTNNITGMQPYDVGQPCPIPSPDVKNKNSTNSLGVQPNDVGCSYPPPPPPGTVPAPTYRGTPNQSVTRTIPGTYWTVTATHTWFITTAAPNGAWYRTYRKVTKTKGKGSGGG